MLVSEIIKPARALAKDPIPGTYSDDALIGQLDLICLEVIEKVRFPFCRISTATVANQQEYMLPETPIDDGEGAVWLNGQLLNKTSVGALQGQPIGFYDQTGQGTQASGSAGPTANAGTRVPQWTVQPPTSFPLLNYQTLRTPNAPWYPGAAPQYAMHGGNILIVPAPNASAQVVSGQPVPNLVIDIVMSFGYAGPFTWNNSLTQLPSLTAPGQRIWFPNNFKPCLVYGLAERIGAMDDTERTKESRNSNGGKYQDQINELMFWAKSYRSFDEISMQTNRSRYVGSTWVRNTQYGGGYP